MSTVISCKTGVLGPAATAFELFPKAGMFHAEAPAPEDGDYAAYVARAAGHGVTIASISTQMNLGSEDALLPLRRVIEGAGDAGVSRIFVSAKTGDDTPREVILERLRDIAAFAHAHGVTICMETHPPLGANGDVARATIDAVNSPGLRYNFDTANIYYYNEGAEPVTELKKVVDVVASVHLKDTDGGFKSPNFPPLGQGVVDFASVFAILAEHGFDGPYTLEIEGAHVRGLDTEGRLDFIRACVHYLRNHGLTE